MPATLIDHGEAIMEMPEALSPAQCGALIACFESEPDTRAGVVRRADGREVVDPSLKRSTDYLIDRHSPECWLEVDRQLTEVMHRGIEAYVERFAWLPKLPTSFCAFQLQRTEPGEAFEWHADEDGRRRLALIIYLNDDFVGGETEFALQKLSYRPRRGSVLMFPPFWTHVHRGKMVRSGVKYVATAFLLHEEAASRES